MLNLPALIETLAAALERPRALSTRVINYVAGTYDVDRDAVGNFLAGDLSSLEDYELDLVLSPLFTPKLTDQAVFAELLGGASVPREQWPQLVQQLAARPTRGQLITPDSRTHTLILREVTIERYVYRLRLDGSIPESILGLIDRSPSAADRPSLKAVARRTVWESEPRQNMLARYLTGAAGEKYLADAVELLGLVESHRPAEISDLLAWIPKRQQTLREQLQGSGAKPFFSEQVQYLHGEERDQRGKDDAGMSAKQDELAFLERLHQVFL